MNDWADKVDVENRKYVDEMKDDGNDQKAKPSKARHV